MEENNINKVSPETDAFAQMEALTARYYHDMIDKKDDSEFIDKLIDIAVRATNEDSSRTFNDYIEKIQSLLLSLSIESDLSEIESELTKRHRILTLEKELNSNRSDGQFLLKLFWDEDKEGEERYDDEEYYPNQCLLRFPVNEIATKPEEIINMLENLKNKGDHMWWTVEKYKAGQEDEKVFIDPLISDIGGHIINVLKAEDSSIIEHQKEIQTQVEGNDQCDYCGPTTKEKVPEKIERIYTHFNVDLDAVASVWALKTFVEGTQDAEISFVPANWKGENLGNNEVALDLDADSKGIKGEKGKDGRVHACFKSIIETFASKEDRKALQKLSAYIDAHDAHGSAVKYFAPEASKEGQDILHTTGLNAILRALQAVNPRDDAGIVEKMSEIFDGLLKAGRARQRGNEEVQEKAEILPSGKVAIVRNSKEYSTNGILFDEYGVRVIVYVDGNNLGIIRHGDEELRMDHEELQQVIESFGEKEEWFAHPAGFLYCRGSRKAPANSPSNAEPYELARKAEELLKQK